MCVFRPVGWSLSGCMCQCVTFPCGVSIVPVCRRRRSCYGAVSFSLRSVQQQAVWLSAQEIQEHQKQDSMNPITDLIDPALFFLFGLSSFIFRCPVPVCVGSGSSTKTHFQHLFVHFNKDPRRSLPFLLSPQGQ